MSLKIVIVLRWYTLKEDFVRELEASHPKLRTNPLLLSHTNFCVVRYVKRTFDNKTRNYMNAFHEDGLNRPAGLFICAFSFYLTCNSCILGQKNFDIRLKQHAKLTHTDPLFLATSCLLTPSKHPTCILPPRAACRSPAARSPQNSPHIYS